MGARQYQDMGAGAIASPRPSGEVFGLRTLRGGARGWKARGCLPGCLGAGPHSLRSPARSRGVGAVRGPRTPVSGLGPFLAVVEAEGAVGEAAWVALVPVGEAAVGGAEALPGSGGGEEGGAVGALASGVRDWVVGEVGSAHGWVPFPGSGQA